MQLQHGRHSIQGNDNASCESTSCVEPKYHLIANTRGVSCISCSGTSAYSFVHVPPETLLTQDIVMCFSGGLCVPCYLRQFHPPQHVPQRLLVLQPCRCLLTSLQDWRFSPDL